MNNIPVTPASAVLAGGTIGVYAVTVIVPSGFISPITLVLGGAPALFYSPAVPGNWAAPAPNSIQNAFDRLAAAYSQLSGKPVP